MVIIDQSVPTQRQLAGIKGIAVFLCQIEPALIPVSERDYSCD